MKGLSLFICLIACVVSWAGEYTVVTGQQAPTVYGDKIVCADYTKVSGDDGLTTGFKIKTNFKGDITLEMQNAINAACRVWESIIIAPNMIAVDFNYCDSLGCGNIIESKIEYTFVGNTVYPYALYTAYGANGISLLKNEADAEIRISSEVEWDCTIDGAEHSKPNLCFYTMRALAQAFGFSTSLCEKTMNDKSFPGFFIARRYSRFDELVFDSAKKRLSSIVANGSRESAELNAFVSPGPGTDVYVLTQDDAHRLYAPTPFMFGQSLALLNNTASLMHYNPVVGSKKFGVDNVTLEVLKAIGWQIADEIATPTPTLTILPTEINSQDVYCAYEPHELMVTTEEGVTLGDICWSFKLPLIDGTYKEILRHTNNQTFTIPGLESVDQYVHDSEGCIEGCVHLTAKANGIVVEADYTIKLSLAPKIVSAEIMEVKPSSNGQGYSITVQIRHIGSEYLRVYIEQEYDPGIRSKTVYTPNIAEVTFDNVSPRVFIWIDIKAINAYDADTYTIELDDEYITNNTK